MPRYDTYFLMKEADVIDYVQTKYPGHFDKDAVLTVKEIGDGNLNYVFRVVEEKTSKVNSCRFRTSTPPAWCPRSTARTP